MTTENPSDELHLLLQTSEPDQQSRILRAVLGSILFHLGLYILFSNVTIFAPPVRRELPRELEARRVTPLIAPVLEPTQTAPNKGKINRNFDVDSLQPREMAQAKKSLPASQPAPRPAAEFVPPTPKPQPQQPQRTIEPPKIEIAQNEPAPKTPPGIGVPNAPLPPPPAVEKPKLAFETPGAASYGNRTGGQITRPPNSLQEATRAASLPGRAAGMSVGDSNDIFSGRGDISKRPTPGRTATNLELMSDPDGVDMRPYLVKVLASVRRNWQAVIPESVRLGRRGRVVIQFAIDREGGVPRLVIATPSGAEPLDRAAVAGVSASNPFPPLPPEFKGGTIRLQLTFSYNMTN